MKRTGLQKNIAFIFDGADAASEVAASPAGSPATQTLDPLPVVERPVANNSLNAPAAGRPATLRPQPIARKQAATMQTLTPGQVVNFVKTRMVSKKSKSTGGKSQKKMTLLVAVLAAAFVGVLLLVLGTSPSKAAAAAKKQTGKSASAVQSVGTSDWKKPEPYPADLRDPMKWSSSKGANDPNGDTTLMVRGIVYSETKPSAIVSGQIVNQGDTIDGVKVIKITKDYVEFQSDDKSWKQQVEK